MVTETFKGIDWWQNISQDAREIAQDRDDEITRPLANVVELREIATQVNLLQLGSFSESDRKAGSVSVTVDKDKLLQLSEESQRILELEEFIPPEATVEIFVSARSRDINMGIRDGARKVSYSFGPRVNILTITTHHLKNGEWQTGIEKCFDNTNDPITLLALFIEQLKSIDGSGSA